MLFGLFETLRHFQDNWDRVIVRVRMIAEDSDFHESCAGFLDIICSIETIEEQFGIMKKKNTRYLLIKKRNKCNQINMDIKIWRKRIC